MRHRNSTRYLKSPHKSPNTSSFFDAAVTDCVANSPPLVLPLPPQISVVFNPLNAFVVLVVGAPQILAEAEAEAEAADGVAPQRPAPAAFVLTGC